MDLSHTWKAFFEEQLTNPDLIDGFATFSKQYNDAYDINAKLSLIQNSDFKCFAFVSAETHHISLCHHYSLVRSSTWKSNSSIHVALSSLNNQADPIIIISSGLRHAAELLMPTQAILSKIPSPDALQNLQNKEPHKLKTLMPPLIQVPPLLFTTLASSTSTDPTELFFLCRTTLFNHANAHLTTTGTSTRRQSEANDPQRQSIINSNFYFLFFLYAATLEPEAFSLEHQPNTFDNITHWASTLHRAHIGIAPTPPPPPTTPPTTPATDPNQPPSATTHSLLQVATALVQAANSLTTSSDKLSDAKTSTSTSSKAWDKQPKFLQDHVLRLMAQNDTDIKTVPAASLVTFLSLSSNSSAAQQYLLDYLNSNLQCQDLRMDTFGVLCLTQLQFIYDPLEGPSRLSLFKIFDQSNHMTASTDTDIIAQATMDAGGDGMSYDQIFKRINDKKLLTSPRTVNDFETTIRNMLALIIFIFGDCYLADQLETWTAHVERQRPCYRHCVELDSQFFANQLTIMDHSIQAFFRSTQQAKSLDAVDFRLLDFDQQQ
jgi:hypothetical protein